MAPNRQISKRSRAARRATSPSIDTDKSLKNVNGPGNPSAVERPAVLSVQYSAGVNKRGVSKRKTQLSAKARKRQERHMNMAEAVVERTSKKLEKSKGRSRVVQDRAKRWEDVNRVAAMTRVLEVEGQDDDDENDNDNEESEIMAGKKASRDAVKPAADEEWETDDEEADNKRMQMPAAPAAQDDELDEIL